MSGDYKRLYRSREERMAFGVCGGLGEYFDVDPTLIRLVFVALIFLGVGSGLLLYIVMAIIVPERPQDRISAPTAAAPRAIAEVEETESDPVPTDEVSDETSPMEASA